MCTVVVLCVLCCAEHVYDCSFIVHGYINLDTGLTTVKLSKHV